MGQVNTRQKHVTSVINATPHTTKTRSAQKIMKKEIGESVKAATSLKTLVLAVENVIVTNTQRKDAPYASIARSLDIYKNTAKTRPVVHSAKENT